MKKRILLIFILTGLYACLMSATLFTACMGTNTITEEGTKFQSGISFKTLEVNGMDVYGKVSNTTETFSFINEVTAKSGAKFVVSLDIYGMQTVVTKTIPLSIGDNTVYVIETVNDEPTAIYTVTVHRRPMFEVTFNTNGGVVVEKQLVEEDQFATEPTTTRTGYTFVGWNYDFTTPITKETNVKASWTANTNTPYTVNYYLQNLKNDNYTLQKTDDLTGTTDTTATATINEYEHFTYNEKLSAVKGNIDGDASLVLSVYYTRNQYTLSINNSSAGSITNQGTYKYGKEITTTATPYLGYEFIGWYSGEELLSTDLTYTFTIEKDVMARFEIKAEMSNFVFTSTATDCSITGIKDKYVTEIIIPDYVTSIGNSAFSYCSGLTRVMIPDSVTSIGNSAFYGCSDLRSIYISDIAAWCNISFGYSYSNPLYYAENLYLNNQLVTELIIPDSVTSIGDYAFSCCSGLTSLTIPESVTSIGDYAFYGCKLVEVVNKSTHITVTKGATANGYVGYYALAVYNRGDTFEGTKLSTDNEYIVYTDGEEKILVGYTGTEADLILPSYITKINRDAFLNCSSLTSIEIPDSVTSIGSYAFSCCSGLTSIEIPDSVTSIGDNAFSYCSGLTSVMISDSVTSIGNSAFYGCSSLTSITMPESVTSIGSCVFAYCDSLTSITIPESVTSIGNSAFHGCSSLTSITFKDTSTWYRTNFYDAWKSKTGGISTTVTNSSTNATCFKSTYCDYFWYKL